MMDVIGGGPSRRHAVFAPPDDAVATAAWRAGLPAGDGSGRALSAALRDAAGADAPVPAVVASALDAEPLACARLAALLRAPEKVLAGLRAAAAATGAPRTILVVPALGGRAGEGALPGAVSAPTARAERPGGGVALEVREVVPFAGCGDPLVLADALGFALPHTPLAPGELRWHAPPRAPLVLGTDLLVALSEAVGSGAPLLRRLVAVAGAVERPGLYDVPLGTPPAWLAGAAGAAPDAVVLAGGASAAAGRRAPPDAPIDAETALLVVVPLHHLAARRAARLSPAELDRERARLHAACSSCRRCTDLCPSALLGLPVAPHLLAGAAHCAGCGVCEAVACPTGLRPRALLADPLAIPGLLFGRAGRDAAARAPDPARTHRRIPLEQVAARLDLAGFVAPDPRAAPVPVRPPLLSLAVGEEPGRRCFDLTLAPGAARPVEAGDLLAEAGPGSRALRLHAPLAGQVKWNDRDPRALLLEAR